MNSADIRMIGRIQSIRPKDEQTILRISAHSAIFGTSISVWCKNAEVGDLIQEDAVQLIIRPFQVTLEDLGSTISYKGSEIKKLSEEQAYHFGLRVRKELNKEVEVKAPMTGIFYLESPNNDSETTEVPVSYEGKVVKEGETLCLIEALLVFSEIPSPVCGQIIAIHAQNKKLVESGQRLITIHPA
jgi:biotin carboxyl carrier protein